MIVDCWSGRWVPEAVNRVELVVVRCLLLLLRRRIYPHFLLQMKGVKNEEFLALLVLDPLRELTTTMMRMMMIRSQIH